MEGKIQNEAAHRKYFQVLRNMTPEPRLLKAFELTEFSKSFFRQGLRKRFPDMPNQQFEELYRKRPDLCHNRNW